MQAAAQNFINPILSGFYPDPSICRADEDYYIVNSSFAYFPGLPIFHSKDLVNWKQIGSALNRPEQLDLEGVGVSKGLFAPSIQFHQGVFYILCTLVDKGGNFIITATDPGGPWSNPVWLPEVEGIDPSLFFDEEERTWIVYNSIPPDNKGVYEGHRTIRMNAFDLNTLKVISDNRILVNGGTDITKHPIWIEGPHLIKKDDWYYLICAEGGTGFDHSAVVFRSEKLEGPYIPYEHNPILTQRHLDAARKSPITTTGHADFVKTPEGKWFAVFLGCRPYEGDYYNTGRETFMAPVEWRDGWPVINPGYAAVQYSYAMSAAIDESFEKLNGNYSFSDDFSGEQFHQRYLFLRTPVEKWYALRKGNLELWLRPETCSGTGNPSFVGFRQTHLKGYAATALHFRAGAAYEKAGLLVFQNEQHFYLLCQSVEDGKPVVQLYKGPGNHANTIDSTLMASHPLTLESNSSLQLKIEANGSSYNFYYAEEEDDWQILKSGVDARFLSTREAGGFVGCVYAMYASSTGKSADSKASYSWFEAKSEDDIYSNNKCFGLT